MASRRKKAIAARQYMAIKAMTGAETSQKIFTYLEGIPIMKALINFSATLFDFENAKKTNSEKYRWQASIRTLDALKKYLVSEGVDYNTLSKTAQKALENFDFSVSEETMKSQIAALLCLPLAADKLATLPSVKTRQALQAGKQASRQAATNAKKADKKAKKAIISKKDKQAAAKAGTPAPAAE